ncbi:GAF domain-containing protein [Oleiharenicola lentus]|uniref:GAF domain-containing protein n=1 Tax=Oleiharenicola lentus TaxID=2508720 RepID=A0A4Q1C8I3_9BACT|nr:GAF domain-containing protein [Oleiharenicola lentus]RXK55255.1 GAF domain-containing protein [Oleiharenicola lentus]
MSAKRAASDSPAAFRARLRRAEMLVKLTQQVAAIESLDELLATLVQLVANETNAERGTLFLNDPVTGELYSRVAQGTFNREIRILNTAGIAGAVFQSGQGEIVHNAYADPRFHREVDENTGFTTKSVLCAPVRTARGEVIGVVQTLNKRRGRFTRDDLGLLEAMALQAASALQSTQFIEKMKKTRQQEMEFLDLVADITSSLDLSLLLRRVMSEATRMLKADRSTLFLNNEKTGELWSEVGEGLSAVQIKLPNTAGIAGAVFQSGKTINIPHAYADLRFNPAFDKKTGYFTRSILCVPVVNKHGKVIGVTQALNKRGGPFTAEDEARLKAFTAQVSIALENAKLFDDVQTMKNYNQSMLESMSNGVITLAEDGRIQTCNAAGYRILKYREADVIGKNAADFFTGANAWIVERLKVVSEGRKTDVLMDAEMEARGEKLSVNLTVQPLISLKGARAGTLLMLENISNEKRMKSTMARYMDPGLADRLLAAGGEILGGQSVEATMLFSDIRAFTTLTEELGAQGTVALLNEYFTVMVNCITQEGGMLDKFIGDAIMAEFGIPVARGDDADRAVRAAIAMTTELRALNRTRQERGQKPILMGIGLNTDTVVSGNIGSPKRMDFTVIGDGVNLASRLESACKEYSAQILISEFTRTKLKGTYRTREVDRVIVKGKTEPVGVHEVLDYHTEESFPHLSEVLSQFRGALGYYRKGDFDRAIKSFKEALSLHPGDRLSATYIERCEYLKAHPPEGKWDGVWVMKSK